MSTKPIVTIFTPQEYNHASYCHTGLFELEKEGLINVRIKFYTKKNIGHVVSTLDGCYATPKSFTKVSYYQIYNPDNKTTIDFAIDMYDIANRFPEIALYKCDYIFKRNFNKKHISRLPNAYKSKIYSFGLTLPLNSLHSRHNTLMFLGLMISGLNLNIKKDSHNFKRVKEGVIIRYKEWKLVKKARALADFVTYNIPKSTSILFQTRCFPHEKNQDVIDIHQQRYDIIKVLKQEFPQEFKGGFMPSEIALNKFKDAITNVPTAPKLYLKAVKEAKIVIYTRGLSESPAWKMAEYLSQGKVIIAERLSTDLPFPLIHKKHVLYFDNLAELVGNIRMVLNDAELLIGLATNARHYFEEHIHPMKNMERILNFMIKDTSRDAN